MISKNGEWFPRSPKVVQRVSACFGIFVLTGDKGPGHGKKMGQ
jgi:hypothetical protein